MTGAHGGEGGEEAEWTQPVNCTQTPQDSIMEAGCEGRLLGFKTTRQKGNSLKRMQVSTLTLEQKQREPRRKGMEMCVERRRGKGGGRGTQNLNSPQGVEEWHHRLTARPVKARRRGHCRIRGTLHLSLGTEHNTALNRCLVTLFKCGFATKIHDDVPRRKK